MPHHLVIGAGAIGAPVARRLAVRGDRVTVGTRRGTAVPGATAVALDVADAEALTRAADGVDAVFVCSNPPYPDWTAAWPAVTTSLVAAASATGATVVLMGNLYGHAPGVGTMREDTPLAPATAKGRVRVDTWQRLLAAADQGVRAVEVRASDYFGLAAGGTAHLGSRFFRPLLAGRTAWCVGDPDQPHSWAYLPDVVEALVAAADHGGSGRAWLAPHALTMSRREIAEEVRRTTGATGRVRALPAPVWAAATAAVPFLREIRELEYQFRAPFVVDAGRSERALGIVATPAAEALQATVASYR